MDALERSGVRVSHDDAEVEPDVYVFEKVWHETRYRKPVVIHAENLLDDGALVTHVHDRGDAIVFNSEWLRWVYFNTFGSELPKAYVIAPGHRAHARLERTAGDSGAHADIMCISKWWKRPYKRFPLIATAFHLLNTELGYDDATLHVLGWFTDQPMPFLDTSPRLWKLDRKTRANPNIRYYQKGFHDTTYDEVLAKSHIVLHPSPIDSGPQVVVEALSQGIPSVVTNNMGGAEWVRDIGPRAGRVLDLDQLTLDYRSISSLPLYERKFCSDTTHAHALALAMKSILDDYEFHRFEPPARYTMNGIADEWLAVIRDVAR